MLRTLSCLIFSFLWANVLVSQTDTEFWFVAPEVSVDHGDAPINLRFSAFAQSSTVTVSMPSNSDFPTQTLTLSPNQTQSLNLTNHLSLVENKPSNQVLNKGILIQASTPIASYYEVSNSFNPEIFLLKGNNALGTTFFVPSQIDFPNVHGHERIDIVATRNNTVVTITPRRNAVGHVAGQTFTVTLNRGQTYSLQASSQSGSGHLSGTKITANKPIAITITDDSIRIGGGWDLLGDQLIPVNLIGTEYIAVRGEATQEKVYIVATQDNTQVFKGNAGTPFITLNEGETGVSSIPGQSLYITSNKPIYVLHLSGIADEAGSGILPPINCTGAQQVGFIRGFGNSNIILLTKAGNEDDFILNGNSSSITASDFSSVPGTNQNWKAARINATTLLNGGTNIVRNDSGLFHLGVQYTSGPGAAYGYFSDYNSLYFGGEITICEGESTTLDAGAGRDSYLWSTGSREQSIEVEQPGDYWVTITYKTCTITDTATIVINDPNVDLGPDTTLCPGDVYTLSTNNQDAEFLWQSHFTDSTFVVREPGLYDVVVTVEGCSDEDEILIDYQDPIDLELGNDTLLCDGESLLLDATSDGATYQWSDGSTQPTFILTEPGPVWVEVVQGFCTYSDTIVNERKFQEIDLGEDTILCEGDILSLNLSAIPATFTWQDGSTSPLYDVEAPGLYIVEIQDACQTNVDSIQVAYEDCSCNLYMGTAFTPNSDGTNDVFGPVYQCDLTQYTFRIFNRWGNLVYETSDPQSGWDGLCKGSPCQGGVYVWVVSYEGIRKHLPIQQRRSGTVTLLR